MGSIRLWRRLKSRDRMGLDILVWSCSCVADDIDFISTLQGRYPGL